MEALLSKIDDIENELQKQPLLYLGKADGNKEFPPHVKDVKDLIVYLAIGSYGLHTYKLSGEFQCNYGRYRSTGDIFLIARTYFSAIKYLDVLKAVAELDNEKQVTYFFCPNIQKRVTIKTGTDISPTYYARRKQDEYGITEEDLNSLLTLK